jgi:hypothetical protein
MKFSSERLQKQAVNYHDEPCSERKCANCFDNGGCMYDRYMIASMEKPEMTKVQQPVIRDKRIMNIYKMEVAALSKVEIFNDQ